MLRLMAAYYIWDLVLVPNFGFPQVSFSAIMHLWLFVCALMTSFNIQEVHIDEKEIQN